MLLIASVGLPLLLVALAVGGYLYANSIFGRIERVPVSAVLTGAARGQNYLIVGSDSRDPAAIGEAGLDPSVFGQDGGSRSDTMLVLHLGDGPARLLSIPRDLYVPIAGTDRSQKINAAYNGGPERLIRTVQESVGIPVDHYMEVDFVSFANVVDALGGVTIDFPHPASDAGSGLDVAEAGPHELDGPQALAYVRARHYSELIDGRRVTDPTADLGRVQRQQSFLRAVFAELGDSRNPFTLADAASGAAEGLRIDDGMSLTDAMRFAWRMRNLDPTSYTLPTDPDRNASGAVLVLRHDEATAVLDQFR